MKSSALVRESLNTDDAWGDSRLSTVMIQFDYNESLI